ncbi:CoA transferase [Streptomyces sp. NPDC002677]|uniref:CoA transferase n=1 Tax=Streptomyces sp. NPDC002677 TaxID=3154774 RepID=UPI003332F10A
METPSRPDGARFGGPVFYDLLHAGHASVVLDPTDTRDRAALHELVGRADVVVEASRPRALAGFGLDVLRADVPVRVQHRSGALWMLNSSAVPLADALSDPSVGLVRLTLIGGRIVR